VIVTKGDCGTCTKTVPVWPGRLGLTIVEVIGTKPLYVLVSVTKGSWGTCTNTVPVWPGRLGLAIVEVTGTKPL
jgi:hypothetical protein